MPDPAQQPPRASGEQPRPAGGGGQPAPAGGQGQPPPPQGQRPPGQPQAAQGQRPPAQPQAAQGQPPPQRKPQAVVTSADVAANPNFSVGELVDLALCSPEIGAVNFNILRLLLRDMVEKTGIDKEPVKMNDLEAHQVENFKNYVQGATPASPMPGVLKIGPQAAGMPGVGIGMSYGPKPTPPAGAQGDRSARPEGSPSGQRMTPRTPKTGGPGPGLPPSGGEQPKQLVGLDPTIPSTIPERVARMEKHLEALYQLPANQEILDRAKADMSVSDMWQIIQLNNRIAAAEAAIQKMASLIEDLARSMNKLKGDTKNIKKDTGEMAQTHSDLQIQGVALNDKWDQVSDAVDKLKNDLENLKNGWKTDRDLIEKTLGVDLGKVPSFMKAKKQSEDGGDVEGSPQFERGTQTFVDLKKPAQAGQPRQPGEKQQRPQQSQPASGKQQTAQKKPPEKMVPAEEIAKMGAAEIESQLTPEEVSKLSPDMIKQMTPEQKKAVQNVQQKSQQPGQKGQQAQRAGPGQQAAQKKPPEKMVPPEEIAKMDAAEIENQLTPEEVSKLSPEAYKQMTPEQKKAVQNVQQKSQQPGQKGQQAQRAGPGHQAAQKKPPENMVPPEEIAKMGAAEIEDQLTPEEVSKLSPEAYKQMTPEQKKAVQNVQQKSQQPGQKGQQAQRAGPGQQAAQKKPAEKMVPPEEIAKMDAAEIEDQLTPEEVSKLSPEAYKQMTPQQKKAVQNVQQKSQQAQRAGPGQQVAQKKPPEEMVPPDEIAKMDAAEIESQLTPEEVSKLSPEMIKQMNPEQKKAVQNVQKKSQQPGQTGQQAQRAGQQAVQKKPPEKMVPPEEIAKMDAADMENQLTPEEVAKLTPEMMLQMTPEQMMAVENIQNRTPEDQEETVSDATRASWQEEEEYSGGAEDEGKEMVDGTVTGAKRASMQDEEEYSGAEEEEEEEEEEEMVEEEEYMLDDVSDTSEALSHKSLKNKDRQRHVPRPRKDKSHHHKPHHRDRGEHTRVDVIEGPIPTIGEPLPPMSLEDYLATLSPEEAANLAGDAVQRELQKQYAHLQAMQRQLANDIQGKMEFIYQKLLNEIAGQQGTTSRYMAVGGPEVCLGPGICTGHGLPVGIAVCQFPEAKEIAPEPEPMDGTVCPGGICPGGSAVCPVCKGLGHSAQAHGPGEQIQEALKAMDRRPGDGGPPGTAASHRVSELDEALLKEMKSLMLLDLEKIREDMRTRQFGAFDEQDIVERLGAVWEALKILKHNEEAMAVKIARQDALLKKIPTKTIEKLSKIPDENLDAIAAGQFQKPMYLPEGSPMKQHVVREEDDAPRSPMRSISTAADKEDIQTLFNNLANVIAECTEQKDRIDQLADTTRIIESGMVTKQMLIDALNDKADKGLINTKVSYDEFGNTVDELHNQLHNLMVEGYQRNENWKKVTADLTEELAEKLDKVEIAPIRAFFKSHLKNLEEKVKNLTALMEEPDPAGTRKKLLRDYTCLSCDRNVNISGVTNGPTLPTIGPILAGHPTASRRALDLHRMRMRKQFDPETKNLNAMERQLKGTKSGKKPPTSAVGNPDPAQIANDVDVMHVVNRYTGGSHTAITTGDRLASLSQAQEKSKEMRDVTN